MKAYHWRELVAASERARLLSKGAPAHDAPLVHVDLPPRREPSPEPAMAAETPTPEPVARRMPVVTFRPSSTPGRSICVECAHYAYQHCTNARARHPVSGTTIEATAARRDKFSCGPAGRYWESRPAQQRRAKPPPDDSEPMEYVPPVPFRRLEPFRDEVIVVLWKPGMYVEHVTPEPKAEPVFGKKYRGSAPGPTAMQQALAGMQESSTEP